MEPQTGGGWGWEVRIHWSACDNPVKGESCPLEWINPGRRSPFTVGLAPRHQSLRIQKSKGLIMQAGRSPLSRAVRSTEGLFCSRPEMLAGGWRTREAKKARSPAWGHTEAPGLQLPCRELGVKTPCGTATSWSGRRPLSGRPAQRRASPASPGLPRPTWALRRRVLDSQLSTGAHI